MRRTCRHRLQFRSRATKHRRTIARRVIESLAADGPEPFVIRSLVRSRRFSFVSEPYDLWATFAWLEQHRFIEVVERRGGKRYSWQLSEQAIRWLDWTGFDWWSKHCLEAAS
jgi:hypothetical protein